jgi:hypothetical protein
VTELSDYPDGTLPISITGCTIKVLPVDISAQSVGNIGIDIAAQSVGNLNVNLAASAVTLNVAIQSSAVTLNVNLTAGQPEAFQPKIILNADFEVAGFGWVEEDLVTIPSSGAATGNGCCKFGIGKYAQIRQGPLTPSVPVDDIAVFTLNVNVPHPDDAIWWDVTYTDGTSDSGEFTYTEGVYVNQDLKALLTAGKRIQFLYFGMDDNAGWTFLDTIVLTLNVERRVGITESIQLDINIAASAVTLNVDITAQSVGNLNVNIAASAVTLDINIASSAVTLNIKTAAGEHVDTDIVSSITLNVDVTAQSVGNIGIDIAAQSVGNINVDIAAQSVDINIKTSGGANIVIDKLTQSAYTERRSTISNNGTASGWTHPTGDVRRGKFFPRGCRGFITTIDLYCRDAGAAGGTITVYLSPHPSMGYLYSADVTVPAGAGSDWRSATFNVMWNYDSFFVFILASSAQMETAFDADTPYDYYLSDDAGATWTTDDYRLHARVVMKGESIGDLPVSGTLNTIEIPNEAVGSSSGTTAVDAAGTETLLTINGAGKVLRLALYSATDVMEFEFYVDGTQIDTEALTGVDTFQGDILSAHGYTASTPAVQLLSHAAGSTTRIAVTIQFQFARKFEVKATNHDEAAENAAAGIVYAKIT